MIDQRQCNAPASPPACVPASPSSPASSSSSSASSSDTRGSSSTACARSSNTTSFGTSAAKSRIRPRGERPRPSYLLPTPAAAPSQSMSYIYNNDTDEEDDGNCSITSQQPQLYHHQHQEEEDSPPSNRRRRRIFLLTGAAAAAAAVVLLIVASIMNASAHGQGPASSSSVGSSVGSLDARDVLLVAERDALAFKRDATGLQWTNDRLKAELHMPSQSGAGAEAAKEEEARK